MKWLLAFPVAVALAGAVRGQDGACSDRPALEYQLHLRGFQRAFYAIRGWTTVELWLHPSQGAWQWLTIYPEGTACVMQEGGPFTIPSPQPPGQPG